MFAPIRKQELGVLVKSLEKAALVGEVVNVSDVVENLVENIMYKMILGRSKYEQFDLKGLVQQVMILIGAFNLADYIPWLGVFDLQGLTRAFKKTSKSLDEVLETILRDHEQIDNVDTIHNEDFIDTLLSIMHQTNDLENEQNHVIDRTTIKAIIQDIIIAGIDTSAVVIEWTLFELLRNSRVMKKLQDEIENEVGHNTMVEEKDLKNTFFDQIDSLDHQSQAPPREMQENLRMRYTYQHSTTTNDENNEQV
ncbi:hypothetical protein RYX36_006720 [Vicia faba]